MGVDWYPCEQCGETFPDCRDYSHCEGCGRVWCSEECAEKAGSITDDDGEIQSCSICRGEDVTDDKLLEYCLSILYLTRKECVDICLASQKTQ
jgi:hypothetical protein